MLKITEREFRHLTLTRLIRAREWFSFEEESRLYQTRLICYFSGNHKAKNPLDLWMTNAEVAKRQKDLIDGRVPFAKFRKLTQEEVKNWVTTKN